MANVEHIRLPVEIHNKIAQRGKMSEVVVKVIKEYVSGEKELQVGEKKEKLVQTTISIDANLVQKAKDFAKEHNLSFNKAIILMLEQSIH
jgi:UDP-N-acetylglucosamine:LPS N-acetylglucosamine transferase